MKIDTSVIEGYAEMTPEQKLAALEALEIADPDYSGYVKKDVFDKTASDLAKLKKDNLAKMTEDERLRQERDEELETLRNRNKELERAATISSYKARYLAMGYDDALAGETAQAWADGDHDKVIANTQAFIQAHDKVVKASMLGSMETPPPGNGTQVRTKEDIMKIADPNKRIEAIAENLELFE